MSLFRSEVLSRSHSRLGRIHVKASTAIWAGAIASAVLAVGIILLLLVGQYARRVSALGLLVPGKGTSDIAVGVASVVQRVLVDEGQRVRQGEVLFLLSARRSSAAFGDNDARVLDALRQRIAQRRVLHESARQQLSADRERAERELALREQELRQLGGEIALRHQQSVAAKDLLNRLEALRRNGFVSETQLFAQRQDALAVAASAKALARESTRVQREVLALRGRIDDLPRHGAIEDATLQRDLAELEQELVQATAAGDVAIRSPVDGLVAIQLAQPGQFVRSGQLLAQILPQGSKLEAQLFVPSSAVGMIDVGDRVRIRYEAFPYQKFGQFDGRIRQIARSAVAPASAPAPVLAAGVATYRVLVELQQQDVSAFGRDEPLLAGMALEADIMLERRSLVEWLFEPLLAVSKRMRED